LSQPNTSPQLQRESPAPRWSCKLVELLLQSWFGGAGALPNTPLVHGEKRESYRGFAGDDFVPYMTIFCYWGRGREAAELALTMRAAALRALQMFMWVNGCSPGMPGLWWATARRGLTEGRRQRGPVIAKWHLN
jgi:hypothetical protein